MKKNKTIAYLMAATLLVGGTFLGTKALFTDRADMIGAVTITTGDVDLSVTEEKWNLERNGEDDELKTDINSGRFENLKFGDKLTRTVHIKNDGTLKAIANIKVNKSEIKTEAEAEDKEIIINGLKYTAKRTGGEKIESTENIEIAAGQSVSVDLEIEVVGKGKHNEEGSLNKDKIQGVDINLENSFVVDARQVTSDDNK